MNTIGENSKTIQLTDRRLLGYIEVSDLKDAEKCFYQYN